MNVVRKAVAVIVLSPLVATASCGASERAPVVASGKSCVARVEFRGHVYDDLRTGSEHVQRGKSLGQGHPLGCGGADVKDVAPSLPVYEAVGYSPADAIYVDEPYGLLRVEVTPAP